MQHDTRTFNGVLYYRPPSRPYFYPKHKYGPMLHQAVWSENHGAIPKGHCIHHIDGNPGNNDLANLVAMSNGEHNTLHHLGVSTAAKRAHLERVRPLAAEWHGSEQGREWHKKHAEAMWKTQARKPVGNCESCGKQIMSYHANARFCSKRCSRHALDREGRYTEMAQCPICGRFFLQEKYRHRPETCGRLCGMGLRRKRKAKRLQHTG